MRFRYVISTTSVCLLLILLPVSDTALLAAAMAPGQDRGGATEESRAKTGWSRVRSNDPEVVALIAGAAEQSYTVSRLLSIVERSDLIVYPRVSHPPRNLPTSQTRLLGAGPDGSRFLVVWIDCRLLHDQQIEMLGHELQHVVEIGTAPEVQSELDLLRFYRRIGYPSWNDRSFETKAAVLVQRMVSAEIEAGRSRGEGGRSEAESPVAPVPTRVLFGEYCAACHGRDGRGRGPAAGVMAARPPDLTRLSERSGGEFPWSRVEKCLRAIDRPSPAKVTEGMPVWQAVASHPSDEVPATRARDLAGYLETLQRRPTNPAPDRER